MTLTYLITELMFSRNNMHLKCLQYTTRREEVVLDIIFYRYTRVVLQKVKACQSFNTHFTSHSHFFKLKNLKPQQRHFVRVTSSTNCYNTSTTEVLPCSKMLVACTDSDCNIFIAQGHRCDCYLRVRQETEIHRSLKLIIVDSFAALMSTVLGIQNYEGVPRLYIHMGLFVLV